MFGSYQWAKQTTDRPHSKQTSSNINNSRERDRDRDRERQRQRQTDRFVETDTERQRQTDRFVETERDRDRDRERRYLFSYGILAELSDRGTNEELRRRQPTNPDGPQQRTAKDRTETISVPDVVRLTIRAETAEASCMQQV